MSNEDKLLLPEKNNLIEILDSTSNSRIWLTSDWHIFKNRYKKENNYVNVHNIVSWCKNNIKDTDVFMYLGDISFRWISGKDKEESAKIMRSIPGIKVLVLGNHDVVAGTEYCEECGFDYIVNRLDYENIVFTHKPINMDIYPEDYINIHGHIHNIREYNTCDGSKNINVYPYFFDNKPVSLEYLLSHKDSLTKNNSRSNWTQIGESANGNIGLSKVLFSNVINGDIILDMINQFKSNITGNVAIKVHAGEEHNHHYLDPKLCNPTKEAFNGTYVDSNVYYESKKKDSKFHKKLAKKHGFVPFDVLDEDGDTRLECIYTDRINKELNKDAAIKIPVFSNGPHLTNISVGKHITNYDSMIVMTHFKGHGMAGFGGSIKNVGMGIPSGKIGKEQVHGKNFEWGVDFLDRLVESAGTIINYFGNRVIYVNILNNLSTKCDCEGDAPEPTMKDIGVLVSDNIVAIEQASLDLVMNAKDGKDLVETIVNRGGPHQIEMAKYLGLGDTQYELIKYSSIKESDIKVPEAMFPNGIEDLINKSNGNKNAFKRIKKQLDVLNTNLAGNKSGVYSVAENKLLLPAIIDENFRYLNSKAIGVWYTDRFRNPSYIDNYHRDINTSIMESIVDDDFLNRDYVDRYVFVGNESGNFTCVGIVRINESKEWNWRVQYPLFVNEKKITNRLEDQYVNEWSMAACNPVKGIIKPHILKMVSDSGSIINTTQYAFSPDLISDKYLVVNENAKLEVVPSLDLRNMRVEQYEFVGDKRLLNKLSEAYRENKTVDNTFFYTALTGKPLLTEDQIDFDDNFTKVDFLYMKESKLSTNATLMESINDIMGIEEYSIDSIRSLEVFGYKSDIVLKESINGYYIYNKLNNKRSSYFDDISDITEAMIKSIY